MAFGNEFTIEFDKSYDEIIRYMESFERLPDEFLEFVGEEMVNIAHEAFDNESSPLGVPWAQRKEPYASKPYKARDPASGPGAKILYRDGDLWRSVTYTVENGKLYIGANSRYAATHQFGDKERGIEARPYIGLTPDFEDRVLGDPAVLELFTA